ncbi:MAG: flavin reductase family protein [Selenomonadaceae bacterium]|nr:flavin reductase family protein [Selenomonadaceae bacterium]
MTKKEINVFDYAGEILKALPKGILLTSEAEDCINAMTIGWGTVGLEWGVPIFTAYIRKSRFTYELIERTGEFTICIPYGGKYEKEVSKIVGICGSQSGRDLDKLAKVGAHIVDADEIRPPAIKELPLTIECREVFKMEQSVKSISSRFKKFYPETLNDEGEKVFDNHVAYYGEILKAYIIEE